MTGPALDYHAHGLQVRSDLALPFAPHPQAKARRAPDLRVRLGAVPNRLPPGAGSLTRTVLWQARPGALLMHLPDVARCLVTGGRDLLVEPLRSDRDGVASFLAGTPLTAALQQRGLLTLHAAAVEAEQGAALLLGPSGAGKSSLAAALVERGFPLLADDVVALSLDDGGRPMAHPEFGLQRLWANSLSRMDWRGRALAPVREGVAKYWVAPQRACARALPVRTAFVLGAESRDASIEIRSLAPVAAFWALWDNTHRKRAMDALGQRPSHFRSVIAMARCLPVAQVRRPTHPFLLEELAERIKASLCIRDHAIRAAQAGMNHGVLSQGQLLPAVVAGGLTTERKALAC